MVTCLTLLILFAGWQGSPRTFWNLQGPWRWLCDACFYLSWGTLLYSLSLTGLGYQTGWTEWWHWFRRRPLPRREFRPRGAYLWLRHPVYLSFLGLIWFTPRMSVDHAILTGIWTVYILVGSHLKDQRLAYYVGATYRHYQQQVAGYPLVFSGPLGRHPVEATQAKAPSLRARSPEPSAEPLEQRRGM
jgi:protein-S-isoprenylcysteine O-methyltransferase Ste14